MGASKNFGVECKVVEAELSDLKSVEKMLCQIDSFAVDVDSF